MQFFQLSSGETNVPNPKGNIMNPDILGGLVTNFLSIAVAVIGVLVGVVWAMIRAEAKANILALDKKASSESLTEVKRAAAESLKDVKQHFQEQLVRQQADYDQRLRVLTEKQDREVDWLKEQMDRISQNLAEMRKESMQANSAIMQRLDQVFHDRRAPTTP